MLGGTLGPLYHRHTTVMARIRRRLRVRLKGPRGQVILMEALVGKKLELSQGSNRRRLAGPGPNSGPKLKPGLRLSLGLPHAAPL